MTTRTIVAVTVVVLIAGFFGAVLDLGIDFQSDPLLWKRAVHNTYYGLAGAAITYMALRK